MIFEESHFEVNLYSHTITKEELKVFNAWEENEETYLVKQ